MNIKQKLESLDLIVPQLSEELKKEYLDWRYTLDKDTVILKEIELTS